MKGSVPRCSVRARNTFGMTTLRAYKSPKLIYIGVSSKQSACMYALHDFGFPLVFFFHAQCPLVPPPQLVRAIAKRSDKEEEEQVARCQAFRLEDTLKWREIDERKLRDERGGDCAYEHPVAHQWRRKTSVLNGRSQV